MFSFCDFFRLTRFYTVPVFCLLMVLFLLSGCGKTKPKPERVEIQPLTETADVIRSEPAEPQDIPIPEMKSDPLVSENGTNTLFTPFTPTETEPQEPITPVVIPEPAEETAVSVPVEPVPPPAPPEKENPAEPVKQAPPVNNTSPVDTGNPVNQVSPVS